LVDCSVLYKIISCIYPLRAESSPLVLSLPIQAVVTAKLPAEIVFEAVFPATPGSWIVTKLAVPFLLNVWIYCSVVIILLAGIANALFCPAPISCGLLVTWKCKR
jgi:hypothetical protein